MKTNTKHMTLTALFVAVILLFGLTPIGMIPLPFIKVTLLCIPVIIGTLLLGFKTGLLLGFAFGAVSALSAFGLSPMTPPSATAALLVSASPVLALVMCFVPRLLVPLTAHYAYKLFSKLHNDATLFTPIAGAFGALVTAVFFLIAWRLVAIGKASVESALPLSGLMGMIVTAVLFIFAAVMVLDFISCKKSLMNYIYFTGALVLVLLGCAVLFFENDIVRVIGLIFGLWLIGDGAIGLTNALMYARRAGRKGWWVLIVLCALLIIHSLEFPCVCDLKNLEPLKFKCR